MTNNLKMGFKALKYGLNFKGNFFAMLLFLVLGFIMMFASPTKILGSVYNSIGAIMVVQLINSVSVSAMVQTSPYKKKLQTIIPALHAGSYLLIINTLNIDSRKGMM